MLKGARALAYPGFRRLWIGQTVSQFGDMAYMLVIFYAVYDLYGRTDYVIYMSLAYALPFLVTGPYLGTLVDRLDRRMLMAASEICSGIVSLSLAVYVAFVPLPQPWTLIAATGVMTVVSSLYLPARSAAIPNLVPEDVLFDANSLAVSTQQVMYMFSTAFSAFLLGQIEILAPERFFFFALLVNAATFFFSGLYIRGLPSLVPKREESEGANGWTDLKEGVRVAFGDRFLRVMFPISLVNNVMFAGFFVVYVVTNEQWFNGNFRTLAIIELAFAGVMALSSLLVIPRLTLDKVGWAFGVGWSLTGVVVVLMGLARDYWWFVAIGALAGLTMPVSWIVQQTYLQGAFADRVRGRVNSVYYAISQGSQPFGLLITGVLLDVITIQQFYFMMGGVCAIASASGLLFAGFREAKMPTPAEMEP